MGVVYRATQLRLERQVALKVMRLELAHDSNFRQRFERESRIAASIDHPHVIPIYEAGEEQGRLYLIMRYVDGLSLGQLIAREGRLSPRHASAMIAQVASALDAAHVRGLVHREVKPANVLLPGGGNDEHAYLSDFGLAKQTDSETSLTQTGELHVTFDYVAPEQLGTGPVDGRADIYSLTALLFHAVTGQVPYPHGDARAKMYAHVYSDPPRPSDLVPNLSHEFDRMIARGMAKDPSDRYPSAGDLGRAAIAGAEGQRPTVPERGPSPAETPTTPLRESYTERFPSHKPPSAATRAIPRPRSRVPLLILAVAVLLGLGGFVGVLAATFIPDRPPSRGSQKADRSQEGAGGDASRQERAPEGRNGGTLAYRRYSPPSRLSDEDSVRQRLGQVQRDRGCPWHLQDGPSRPEGSRRSGSTTHRLSGHAFGRAISGNRLTGASPIRSSAGLMSGLSVVAVLRSVRRRGVSTSS
jgi:serine/threonine protein kinase